MEENKRRVERIKKALGCKTNTALAKRIGSHAPNITRWRKQGFYPSMAGLIDELIKEGTKLTKRIKELEREFSSVQRHSDINLAPETIRKIDIIKEIDGKNSETANIIQEAIAQYYTDFFIRRLSDLTQRILREQASNTMAPNIFW